MMRDKQWEAAQLRFVESRTPSPKLSETWWERETKEGRLPESQIPQPTRGQTKNWRRQTDKLFRQKVRGKSACSIERVAPLLMFSWHHLRCFKTHKAGIRMCETPNKLHLIGRLQPHWSQQQRMTSARYPSAKYHWWISERSLKVPYTYTKLDLLYSRKKLRWTHAVSYALQVSTLGLSWYQKGQLHPSQC